MNIDSKRPTPGTWFQFPGDEAKLCLRLLTGFRVRQIERETQTISYTYNSGTRFEDVVIDHEGRQARVWDETIVDWSGIADEAGKPLPCDRASKTLLMSQSVAFSNFYLDRMVELGRALAAEEAEEEKNSSASPSGSEPNRPAKPVAR